MTVQTIIRDIVAGERDPKALARHRDRRVKASAEEIAKALTRNWREEHLFVLRQALAMYDDIARHLSECDSKLQELLRALGQRNVDLDKVLRAGSKTRQEFDARQMLANWAGVDLTRINGLGVTAVMKILSELGPRPEPLRNRLALLFVARAVPGHQDQRRQGPVGQDQTIGQLGAPALKMAAMSLSHSDSALGAFYRRLCSRMDKPSANTATAYKLARMVYFMLTRGEPLSTRGSSATKNSNVSAALPL